MAGADGRGGDFRRIGGAGGDGGVEALRIGPGSSLIGYQAKYYPDRTQIDWNKVDNSVQTALTQHRSLSHYVVALPCLFTGKRAVKGGGSASGDWGVWDSWVARWNARLQAEGRIVQFEVWTGFELKQRLLANLQYVLPYYFGALSLSSQWFAQHLERTRVDLGARYSPSEHVSTQDFAPFDVILRSERIRRDLNHVFVVAADSKPIEAYELYEPGFGPIPEIAEVVEAQEAFLGLRSYVMAPHSQRWPVESWMGAWFDFTRLLLDAIRGRDMRPPQLNSEIRNRAQDLLKVYELTGREVFGGRWAQFLPIDVTRGALLVGSAGSGKSHLLAHAAATMEEQGIPVIHLLGQHIVDGDPRVSILRQLQVEGHSFSDLLDAFDLHARSLKRPGVVLIDGINEGNGLEVWPNHLAAFVHEITRREALFVVMSCRAEYVEYIIPADLDPDFDAYRRQDGWAGSAKPGKLIQCSVSGFATYEEREAALRMFMDARGIVRPMTMMLDAEFFNPLFLTSVCRAMERASLRVFPSGMHGARQVFHWVLDVKAGALGTRHDRKPRLAGAVRRYLLTLAQEMVEQGTDFVDVTQALTHAASAFAEFPLEETTWLEVLTASDLLRRDPSPSPTRKAPFPPEEVVRFAFQRLQDNYISEFLLDRCEAFDDVFLSGRPLEPLLTKAQCDGRLILRPVRRWAGVLSEVWAGIAERSGRELLDLPSFFATEERWYIPSDFEAIFAASVRSRSSRAFSPYTLSAAQEILGGTPGKVADLLLVSSCVPGHAWNADFLTGLLRQDGQTSDMRAAWARVFEAASPATETALRLISWCEEVEIDQMEDEVIRLASVTLGWLIASESTAIGAGAARGLVRLLVARPVLRESLLPEVLNLPWHRESVGQGLIPAP